MLKVGITGGIGVGKTIVARMFEALGIPVYDSDRRAKWVMHHDESLRKELTDAYGQETFMPDGGELNRAYLSSIVFNNPERLAQLNALVHPHVRQDFNNWVKQHAGKPYVMKEAALMYESEAWKQVDKMVTVFAPMDVRVKRLLLRDTHRSEADINSIIEKQLTEEEKIARADYVVYNDDKQMILPQVLALHQKLLAVAAGK